MKRILFVALAATLLAAGCQKTEIINQVPGEALTFSTHMGKLTKVSDADSSGVWNLREQDFKVWAFKAYADAVNGDVLGQVYDNMTAIDVTSADGVEWDTALDYYWPGVEKELDFFAVSTRAWPAPEATDENGATIPAVAGISVDIEGEGVAAGSRKLTVKDYVVNHDNPNDDLMVAEFVRQHQGMNEKNVKLHFKHALAKVQFKFLTTAPAEDVVNVNSLAVAELKTSGTLEVKETATGYTDNTGSDAINNPLSVKRANAVADFLKIQGVAANRVIANGYGSANPIASNATAAGREQNRRVEVMLINMQ
jgi:hypothetical protein